MMRDKVLNKKIVLGAMITSLCMLGGKTLHAQDAIETPQTQQTSDTKSGRKLAEKQKEQEQKKKKATAEALKQHEKNQTPEVRKRMKEDAKRANRNNSHKSKFFLGKLFGKKDEQ